MSAGGRREEQKHRGDNGNNLKLQQSGAHENFERRFGAATIAGTVAETDEFFASLIGRLWAANQAAAARVLPREKEGPPFTVS